MKTIKILIIAFLSALTLTGCSSSGTTETEQTTSNNPFALVTCVLTTNDGYKAYVNGQIFSDKSVLFDYCKINNLNVTRHAYTYNGLKFGNFDNSFTESITQNLDELNCELKTSAGIIKGSVSSLPVPPQTVTYNHNQTDTLKTGDSLTINWENTGANYYHLSVLFGTRIGMQTVDTMVVGNKVVLSYDSFFKKMDGSTYMLYITAISGPYPDKNAVSNLKGDNKTNGQGYLYFRSGSKTSTYYIVLGNGMSKSNYSQPRAHTEAELTEQFNQSVLKKLGVSK